jgi:pimeloyl-ACP methyl ester carboxylesterase
VTAGFTRQDVVVAGGQLAVWRLTSGGPPVVAVHGILSSSRAWVAVARALGERASLHAVDLRGRGRSNGLPPPYGIREHVADVLAVVDALSVDQAVLVGHSLGAYVIAQFAVDHPDRVRDLLLVDGGLRIPGTENVDPQVFADAFLGPALARLKMTFASHEEYRGWWRQHPAMAGGDVDDDVLTTYADYDLEGSEPALRSAVREPAVRADAGELGTLGEAARAVAAPARLLVAPRGLVDDPNPMQPLPVAEAWAAEDPSKRTAALVEDVNHYTITLGARGAAVVADAIADATSTSSDGSR